MNVVILAAGRGERFAIEGISVPKPLIEFRGRSLLKRSVDVAKEIARVGGKGRIIIVATEPVAQAAERIRGVDHVVPVSVTQPGPAASAQLALAHLPDDEPVVVMDCDNYYPSDTRTWVSELPVGADFMTVHRGVPRGLHGGDFCGAIVGPDGRISLLLEKGMLEPEFVGTGIYGFSAAARLRCWFMIDPKGRERSMSDMLPRQMLYAVEVPAWHPIGTPDQMRAAAAWRVQSPTSNE